MGRTRIAVAAAAAVVLLSAGWAWIMSRGSVAVPVRLWPGGPDVALPAGILPVLGMLAVGAAAALALSLRRPSPAEEDAGTEAAGELAVILVMAVAALAVLLLVGVEKRSIGAPQAALVLVCGTLALLAGGTAVLALKRGETVELSSHWGGLGGSMGGWRVSPVTILLLLALLLLGTMVAVGVGDTDDPAGNKSGGDKAVAVPKKAGGAGKPAEEASAGAAGNGSAGAR